MWERQDFKVYVIGNLVSHDQKAPNASEKIG